MEIIRLQNASASDVMQVVQAMDLIQDGAAISIDRRSNALVLSGPEALRHRVRVLVSELDTQRDTVVARTIGLNYADAASIADVVLRTLNAEGGAMCGLLYASCQNHRPTRFWSRPRESG
ncbi:secretin N-terminal domain-containing protein [Parasedimentitalea marina]|uniref:secretin N-terminal domain-containing protein n=1 Tax=Parasedimentitalea marina TaxID=2483033 RepID=UPI001EE8F099|nr:secretin N-terminal domain-containing protein [Parasedimentitalea marina]